MFIYHIAMTNNYVAQKIFIYYLHDSILLKNINSDEILRETICRHLYERNRKTEFFMKLFLQPKLHIFI